MVYAGGEHSQAINLSLQLLTPFLFFPSFYMFRPSGHLLMLKSAFCCLRQEKRLHNIPLWGSFCLLPCSLPAKSKSAAMCHPCCCLRQRLWGHKTWQALEQPLTALVCISSYSCYCQHTLRQKSLSNQNPTYWHIMSPSTGSGRFLNSKFFPCMLMLFSLYSACPPLSYGGDEHKTLRDTHRSKLHPSVQPTHVSSLLELTLQRQHS